MKKMLVPAGYGGKGIPVKSLRNNDDLKRKGSMPPPSALQNSKTRFETPQNAREKRHSLNPSKTLGVKKRSLINEPSSILQDSDLVDDVKIAELEFEMMKEDRMKIISKLHEQVQQAERSTVLNEPFKTRNEAETELQQLQRQISANVESLVRCQVEQRELELQLAEVKKKTSELIKK
eukprot:TRINITY_DN5786_c0_g1_i4.p1 TRINITY_DN5786_c0_g1~~TRINITY_DN5786_c0_g1_i4.p1  ORF type:complete len:178 (-),score=37.78 TRINITY_DN5786_c0_g1_i4:637-1170(-)